MVLKSRKFIRGGILKPKLHEDPNHIIVYTAGETSSGVIFSYGDAKIQPRFHFYILYGLLHEPYDSKYIFYVPQLPLSDGKYIFGKWSVLNP